MGKKAAANEATVPAKTECPFTLEAFLQKARTLALMVDGQPKAMAVKDFKTGSFGWFTNEKITLVVDGKSLRCQMNFSIVAVGSKEVPRK